MHGKDWKSLEVIRMAKPPFPSSWALQGGSALVSTVPKPGKALCWNRTIKENTEKSCKIDTSDTCEIFFWLHCTACLECCIPFILTIIAIGIVSLLFPFAYIRYQNFWAANCIMNSHRENNESASHPVGFLECWESGTWSAPLLSKWLDVFISFFNQVHLGHASTFFWMVETLQNCTWRLNGALRTYRTKPPLW